MPEFRQSNNNRVTEFFRSYCADCTKHSVSKLSTQTRTPFPYMFPSRYHNTKEVFPLAELLTGLIKTAQTQTTQIPGKILDKIVPPQSKHETHRNSLNTEMKNVLHFSFYLNRSQTNQQTVKTWSRKQLSKLRLERTIQMRPGMNYKKGQQKWRQNSRHRTLNQPNF